MLLQRVNLKGFLAHRGVQESDSGGFNLPVELDFRGSSLWLIHGPNGSGKSSIFDAVTFALYDRARGRGDGFGDFINDRCDRAEVEVEVEIGGVGYQINRGVSRGRNGRGAGHNSSQVHRQMESGLQIEAGTSGAVPAWTEKMLRLSYDNFVCAAILRQGEADAFLKAKPAFRKRQLMKLLDMDVYERLGEAANARRTQTQTLLRARQTELAACGFVSDEQLEAARVRLETAEEALRVAGEQLEAQAARVRDAQHGAQWLGEIAEKEEQQGQDCEILGEAARIGAAADRHWALGSALPRLEALWRLRIKLKSEKEKLASAHEKLAQAQAQANLGLLAPQLESAQSAEGEAQSAVAAAQNKLVQIERDTARLDGDLANLKRIEKLERQIGETENSIAPFREILAAADALEMDYKRFRNLDRAGHKLSPLVSAEKRLSQSEMELTAAQQRCETAQKALAEAQDELEARENALAQLEADIETLRPAMENLARRLHTLREKLGHREGLGHAEDCPTCGSHLHEPEARARLEREREVWKREDENLNGQSKSLEEKRKELQCDRIRAVAALKSARNAAREAEKRNSAAQSDQSNAGRRFDEATRERDEALAEAGEDANRIGDYEAICTDYKRLQRDGIAARHQELLDARGQTSAAQTSIEIYRRQLRDELPHWEAPKREQLRDEAAQIESQLAQAKSVDSLAQKAAQDAAQLLKKLEGQGQKLSRALELLHGQCEDGAARVQSAAREVEAELDSLGEPWNDHAAARDAAQLGALQDEFGALEDVPHRLETLRAAQGRVKVLSGQIETLQENLEKLPAAHRIAPDAAMEEKKGAEAHQKKAQTERDEATKHLAASNRLREDYEDCLGKRDEAEQVFSRAEKLARAFGPSGLQAKIVAEAQRTIGVLANESLAKLSQGNWQIDLRENSTGTELEIIARDLGRGGKERPFECLSGGERFRVAISLAIAIGQSACGGQAINTLVIDEGFGALDDLNRALLVTELRRLSEQVLRGGRIIIVSHQDDVQSEFDFRYQLSRDSDGYAQVKRFTP